MGDCWVGIIIYLFIYLSAYFPPRREGFNPGNSVYIKICAFSAYAYSAALLLSLFPSKRSRAEGERGGRK